jgi:hypothetical protein
MHYMDDIFANLGLKIAGTIFACSLVRTGLIREHTFINQYHAVPSLLCHL